MMKEVFTLEGKTILITGASSGIGRQCAVNCSEMGARIIAVGLEENKLKETISLLSGENHISYCQDVTVYDKLEPMIRDAVEKAGKISGFIHSAGIEMNRPLKTLKAENYLKAFSVNAVAGFEFMRIISKMLYLSEQGGSFVLISSVMGQLGDIGNIAYCSSKGSLLSAGKAFALELAPRKIRVNCILPGVVDTDMSKQLFDRISVESRNSILNMHPLGFGTPNDIANACVFLLSDASRWITGSDLIVDGGYSAH